jgi:uncharacterized protein
MNYGLRDEDLSYIREQLKQHQEIDKAVIFGSRAMNTYRAGSDVDLAIFGEGVNFTTISELKGVLEDQSPMPYLFDIVDATHLKHKELEDHIKRVGIPVYQKASQDRC